MTLKDLHNYYLEKKDSCNEIVLFHHKSNKKHGFRHYTEIFTGENRWLNLSNGYIYKDKDILGLYEIEENKDILDILKSMGMLTDIKVKNDIDGIPVQTIRKIDDNAFVRVEDGKVMSGGFHFVYNINEFRNYEVVQ